MRDTISDIRTKINSGVYQNEEHVRLSLVARVLSKLGWNIWDPGEVNCEYNACSYEDSSKVDIALFSTPRKPDVFIEVKAIGKIRSDLEKTETQLRDYNRDNTALFSIITDGQNWRFYFSQTGGKFSEKCFKSVNLLDDDLSDIEDSFNKFLSKSTIENGSAATEAQKYLHLSEKQRVMEDKLPEAKRAVLIPPYPSLPEALKKLVSENGVTITVEEAQAFIAEMGNRPPPPVPPNHGGYELRGRGQGKESSYIKSFRNQLKDPNNLISKIKRFIDEKGSVSISELRRVCVDQFGCKSDTSGSIGACIQVLLLDGYIREEGRADNRRFFSLNR